MEINADNLVEYLYEHTNLLNKTGPVEVVDLSNESSDPEAEGFVNFLFRVTQGKNSYVVKQARPYLRRGGITDLLPVERNLMEYVSFKLRDNIAKGFVPALYFVDPESNIFIMEDMRSCGQRVMRFQLNEGKEFPNFPKQLGLFLARNHFYTSELYLSKSVFRELQQKFANVEMRNVMEDVAMLCHGDFDDTPLGEVARQIWQNDEIRLALIEVRDNFIKKAECLVHGDLHTSNIFIDDTSMSVIDMEYSFVAPFSYDLGYLLANFVSQYAAFSFNPAFSNEQSLEFKAYLLDTISQVLNCYFEVFTECFKAHGKPLYAETPGYLDNLFKQIMHEVAGVMATPNMLRIIGHAPFPDFDVIDEPRLKFLAQGLSLAIDEYLLKNRHTITTPVELIAAIKAAENRFTIGSF